ncbi:hypothetical protein DIPPA_34300 [Diplonema papillatum]|nr:hypothetical protein DIPPA_34300 [Diplonema papillatum]
MGFLRPTRAGRFWQMTAKTRAALEMRWSKASGLLQPRAIGEPNLPTPPLKELATAGTGVFTGISALSVLHFVVAGEDPRTLLLASFGATSLLIFTFPHRSFSQPRNVVGGHVLACITGVAVRSFVGATVLSPALAVSFACCVMLVTRTFHPPAGGTALNAVLAPPELASIGFELVIPSALGSGVLVFLGLVFNNLVGRRYPVYWK